jgi:uncharacterized protein (DUF1501 family)
MRNERARAELHRQGNVLEELAEVAEGVVLGGAVRGRRIYGEMPVLQVNGPDDTEDGRWIPSTAVDEYAATLARWFGVAEGDLPVVLPNLGRFRTADLGFMV